MSNVCSHSTRVNGSWEVIDKYVMLLLLFLDILIPMSLSRAFSFSRVLPLAVSLALILWLAVSLSC